MSSPPPELVDPSTAGGKVGLGLGLSDEDGEADGDGVGERVGPELVGEVVGPIVGALEVGSLVGLLVGEWVPPEQELLRSNDRPVITCPEVVGAPLPPFPGRPQAEIDPVPSRLAKARQVEKTATWPEVVGAPLPPYLE